MKHQLSNNQTKFAQIILVLIGVGFPCSILAIYIFGSDNLGNIARVIIAGFSIVIGLSILYFSAHLYKVTFDRDFVYISRIGRREKINIDKIEEIKPCIVPFRLFKTNAYILTVIYFDNQRKYKIYLLSKGATGLVGTIGQIPLLSTLRQFIKDRKYSR